MRSSRLLIAFTFALVASQARATSFVDRTNVTSPKPFQIFQRSGTTCTVLVSGSVLDGANTHTIEANVDGGSFTTITSNTSTTYSGNLTSVAQGVHLIRIRYQDSTQNYIDVPTVGCGDLFVIAGQSNAVGQTNTNWVYLSNGRGDGLSPFASAFGGDYAWHLLNDGVGSLGCSGWVDTVNNNCGSAFGSIWPIIATSFIASTNVPIGFVNAAIDSSTISQWIPGSSHTDRTTAYGAAVFRGQRVSATWKGVLWWQGEGDALAGTAGATYTANLETVADAFFTDLGGAVLVPVRIQQGADWTTANMNVINTAITNAHNADSAHIASPADFSNLYADDGAHLKTDGNVLAAANGGGKPPATVTLWSAIKTQFSYPRRSTARRRGSHGAIRRLGTALRHLDGDHRGGAGPRVRRLRARPPRAAAPAIRSSRDRLRAR